MKHGYVNILPFFLLLILNWNLFAAPDTGDTEYKPSPENLANREWFQNAKFGLFIHWGVYSIPARGEWVMRNENIPVSEYEKLPPQFDPLHYDPQAWCRIAKDAGIRYITITSKHHDGFAMFNSKESFYDIVDSTPYGKDVLKPLADACREYGLKLFFYHSLLDWHHPDYFPRGEHSHSHSRPDSGDWYRYLDYMDTQLKELLTGYGPIAGIWFDGMWDKPVADWRLGKTYRLIHALQPGAMIGNNHHVATFPGEDFQMFEKGLPGKDPFNKGSGISMLPLETCQTINESWGYVANDDQFKTVEELIHILVSVAGNNSNLLLNVGPKPDGTIQNEQIDRLRAMGEWLKKWGESIYDTRGGPFPPQSWGVSTHNGNRIFVHVLAEDNAVTLPDIGKKVTCARIMADSSLVAFVVTELGTILRMPENRPDEYDTIVEISLEN